MGAHKNFFTRIGFVWSSIGDNLRIMSITGELISPCDLRIFGIGKIIEYRASIVQLGAQNISKTRILINGYVVCTTEVGNPCIWGKSLWLVNSTQPSHVKDLYAMTWGFTHNVGMILIYLNITPNTIISCCGQLT